MTTGSLGRHWVSTSTPQFWGIDASLIFSPALVVQVSP
ncbi:hypothetical protein SynBIOSE41_03137 [Synechococcus sp. BIOS-E4-1]|nr:hypothetical protein SynBIOSE41_03137 [Synechococcus sp. BIOS-E4-1]